ncbi:PDZ domain-containing protein [candidate division GN15 bacterium]|nr:PDZ domain-containing protein [candidate division GN15 bacterium]
MARTVRTLLIAVLALGLLAGMAEAKSKRVAWMGVYTQSVDRELAKAFDLGANRGAIVNEVVEGSPAEAAGLAEDDIVIEFDGRTIRDSEDLTEAVRDQKPGDEVAIKIIREGKEQELTLTLEGRRKPAIISLDRNSNAPHAFWFDAGDRDRMRGYIGVRVQDLTPQLGEYFGVDRARGALVTQVESNSPAEKAGVKAGDVIVAINDETVFDSRDVSDLIGEFEEGAEVTLHLIRDKDETSLTASVEEQKREFFGGQYVPDMARWDIDIPAMRGLRFGDTRDLFDSDEFRQEMEELKRELEALQRELKEMKLELDQQ